jgi:predicted metal-dependent hydrolase
MADITVRKIRFSFGEALDFEVGDDQLGDMLGPLALSMTMPHLEPYLIRTMKVARKQISDPVLAEDASRFSQQEGHHYRNHAMLNEQILSQFDDAAADRLRGIEADMEADYQRFSKQKSLRFNLAYAEGFEAMTCAVALAMAEHGAFEQGKMAGGEIWAWHMAEEIEHRSVAFGVYDHLVGSYPYRIVLGTWSQYHFVSYIARFSRCMAEALGRKPANRPNAMTRTVARNYFRTWSPFYDPARIPLPDGVQALLDRYSAIANV